MSLEPKVWQHFTPVSLPLSALCLGTACLTLAHDQHSLAPTLQHAAKVTSVFRAPLFWGAHRPYWAPRIRKAPASRTCRAAGTERMLLQPPASSPCCLISLIPLFPLKQLFVPTRRTLTAVAVGPWLEVGVQKPQVEP